MENNRPDPDKLLEQVKEEESRINQGKLKIFFGYAAGVGKTYAMLEAAAQMAEAGVDVAAGYHLSKLWRNHTRGRTRYSV